MCVTLLNDSTVYTNWFWWTDFDFVSDMTVCTEVEFESCPFKMFMWTKFFEIGRSLFLEE